jgi:hypothetical protein
MDRIIYFIAVLALVGYFIIPKISGAESPQVYWQWETERLKTEIADFKNAGGLSQYIPKKFTPQGVGEMYQNLISEKLQTLEKVEDQQFK